MKTATQQKIDLSEDAPILLRRLTIVPKTPETVANMTVVTTGGTRPEMHDQQSDATAPRRD